MRNRRRSDRRAAHPRRSAHGALDIARTRREATVDGSAATRTQRNHGSPPHRDARRRRSVARSSRTTSQSRRHQRQAAAPRIAAARGVLTSLVRQSAARERDGRICSSASGSGRSPSGRSPPPEPHDSAQPLAHRLKSDRPPPRLTPRSIFSYWRLTWRRLIAVFGPPLLVLIVGIVAHEGTMKITSTRADGRRSRAVTDAADQLVAYAHQRRNGAARLSPHRQRRLSPPIPARGRLDLRRHRAAAQRRVRRSGPRPQRSAKSTASRSSPTSEWRSSPRRFGSARASGAGAALALVKTNHGLDVMRNARRIAGLDSRSAKPDDSPRAPPSSHATRTR